ncbi:MAG: ATP-binding protein [Gallionella sp.]|nr:ATP-binding protein [Gallionella sp.]MDD5611899.1 ATP-binding protein [Gallionella sp.]
MANALNSSACQLEAGLEWLAETLRQRLTAYFAAPGQPPASETDRISPAAPGFPWPTDAPDAALFDDYSLSHAEQLVLLLAIAPALRPQLLDVLLTRNEATGRGFAEFGGMQGASGNAFLPTLETACFLLAGDDLAARLETLRLFGRDQPLLGQGLLELLPPQPGEAFTAALLQPSTVLLQRLLAVPHDDAQDPLLPAQRMQTGLDWDYLVLPAHTLEQLDEMRVWLAHGAALLDDWGMRDKLRPGYTSLFYGPPGTGKTLAASLIGKLCGREVYKIDLSMVVSKYIGETEKNLARVFDRAARRDWILFFDEADALFGKRTSIHDAHDRYANQEVSYLLQRIEEYPGVAILASNLKGNMDDAFLRRFQSVIHFPLPGAQERLKIWREALPEKARLEPGLELEHIAEQHELSGGTIMNVVRFVSLRALQRGDGVIRERDLEDGIQRELHKEGRAF